MIELKSTKYFINSAEIMLAPKKFPIRKDINGIFFTRWSGATTNTGPIKEKIPAKLHKAIPKRIHFLSVGSKINAGSMIALMK